MRSWTRAPTAMPTGRCQNGIGRGTPVALLMENRPDYIAAWLGLFKVGAQVALINTNLVGTALAHSIAISGARHAIVGAELADQLSRSAVRERARAVGRRATRRQTSSATRAWRAAASDGRSARQTGARGRDAERPRLLHLHLRHHRPAQGGEFQPYAHAVHDERLCRGAAAARRRPHLRSPAALSFHRRGLRRGAGLLFRRGADPQAPAFGA